MQISNEYIVIALLVGFLISLGAYIVGFSMGRKSAEDESENKEEHSVVRKASHDEDLLREMKAKVERLNYVNDRYLNFVLNIPTVVTRLNTLVKVEDINSALLGLVKDIITTDTVELYIYQKDNNTLNRVSTGAQGSEEIVCPLGEGLVGRSAQDLMVRIKGHGESGYGDQKETAPRDSHLWMAAPIHFNKRLLGVIGIGQVKNPSGEERNLLKMITDIAAVTLVNQASLGEAQKDAVTDPLTGLFNRRYFFDKTREFVEQAVLKATPISIFLFDIDNFKHYNDTNGHAEGDRLLKELSNLIRGVTRKSTVLARYGGEEFIVMMPEISKEDCFTYANRLREKIASHPFPHREKQPLGTVSVSGGVASFPVDGNSVQEVIRLADAALYQAKQNGRNRVDMHKPFMFSDLSGDDGNIISGVK